MKTDESGSGGCRPPNPLDHLEDAEAGTPGIIHATQDSRCSEGGQHRDVTRTEKTETSGDAGRDLVIPQRTYAVVHKAQDPVTGRTTCRTWNITVRSEANEQALASDTAWFDDHPLENERIRLRIPGEFGPLDEEDPFSLFVKVTRQSDDMPIRNLMVFDSAGTD